MTNNNGFINKIKNMMNGSFPVDYSIFSKRKKVLFYIFFFLLLFSIFGTIFFQAPQFVNKGINNAFSYIWIIIYFVFFVLDYKKGVFGLFRSVVFFLPYFIYVLLSIIFGASALQSALTRSVFMSMFIFALFCSCGQFITSKMKEIIIFVFIVSSFLLGLFIYFTALRGADLDSQIYAYGSKNSSGPILFCASLFVFFVTFFKNKHVNICIKLILALYFFALVILMKCRAVILIAPFIYFILFLRSKPSAKTFLIVTGIIIVFLVLLFAVPFFRETIIFKIIFNNKGDDLDVFSSGRLSQIVGAFSSFKPFLGTGDTYVDCFPVQLICSAGIVGTLLTIPSISVPFYVLIKMRKENVDFKERSLFLALIILYAFNSLLEGHGYFGPGAKTFVVWLFSGFYYSHLLYEKPVTYVSNKIEKINSNIVVGAFCSILYFLSFSLIISSSLFNNVSSKVFDIFDKSIVINEYVPVNAVESDVTSIMCVGQKTKFYAATYPENATDNGVGWISYNGQGKLEIDSDGVAHAVSKSTIGVYSYSLSNPKVGITKTVKIVDVDDFDFGEYSIWCDSNINNLKIGQRIQIEYDKSYIPNPRIIHFESSDSTIASVDDDGIVCVNSAGRCLIKSFIDNGIYHSESNVIEISSINEKITPMKYLDVSVDETCYSNVPYSFTLDYNSDATDKSVNYFIEGLKYQINKNGTIVFLDSGTATLQVQSFSNPSIKSKKIAFNVKQNNVKSISLKKPSWITIGDYFDLDFSLTFENGYARKAQTGDLKYTSSRVSFDRSGVCGSNLSYCSLKSGSASVTVQSINNPSLSHRFTFEVKKYTVSEYRYKSGIIGALLCCILLLMGNIISFGFSFRKKIIIQSLLSFVTLALLIIVFTLHSFSGSLFLMLPVFLIYLFFTILLFVRGKHIQWSVANESSVESMLHKEICSYKKEGELKCFEIDI